MITTYKDSIEKSGSKERWKRDEAAVNVILKGFPESYTTFANHYETKD